INGALHSTVAPGARVRLDTASLPEGASQIVAVAADDTDVATTGRFVGELLVDNTPAAATLTPDMSTLSLGEQVRLTLSAPGAEAMRVVHNGRVVGAVAGGAGDVRLFGRTLGAGPVHLQAVAEYPDGALARSERVRLTVTNDGATTG